MTNVENPRTLMVLGKNIGEDWTGQRIRRTPHHLSPHGRIGVLAAGVAIKEGLADEVIFTITNTAGSAPLTEEDAVASRDLPNVGKPVPSEAELMAAQFKRIFPSLADKVKIQPFSWDTNTDAKEARKLIKHGEIDPERLSVMTTGFHAPRTDFLFRRAGVPTPLVLVSERILARKHPGFAQAYEQSELYQKEVKKEDRILAIQKIPLAADLITFVTKRSRTK